jgi:hypothetical protein
MMVLCHIFFLQFANSWTTSFRNSRLSRGGRNVWPSRSPDLNLSSFCIWGYLKSTTYAAEVSHVQDFQGPKENGIWFFREMLETFQRVRQSLFRSVTSSVKALRAEFGHFFKFQENVTRKPQ